MMRVRFGLAWALAVSSGPACAQTAPDPRPTVTVRPPDLSVSATIAPAPKPKAPTPARVLQITNGSSLAVASLEVAADGLAATIAAPLAADGVVTLRLPAFKSCKATITVRLDEAEEAETFQQDLCKDRTIRLRD